jgi:hypothetical protein
MRVSNLQPGGITSGCPSSAQNYGRASFQGIANQPAKRDRMTVSYHRQSLQPCVLRLGLSEDGDVGVSVFPERKEILVGGSCFGLISR